MYYKNYIYYKKYYKLYFGDCYEKFKFSMAKNYADQS